MVVVSFVTGNPSLGEAALNGGYVRLSAAPNMVEQPGVATDVEERPRGTTLVQRLNGATLPREQSTLVVMLGVPSRLVPTGVISVLAPWRESISHVRVARHCEPPEWPSNLALIFVKFVSCAAAAELYSTLHGRAFNAIDSERCWFAFAVGVEWVSSSSGSIISDSQLTATAPDLEALCVVCLEPLKDEDSTSFFSRDVFYVKAQLFTTACDHSFHTECLSRWADAPCAVCRYHHSRVAVAMTCFTCGCAVTDFETASLQRRGGRRRGLHALTHEAAAIEEKKEDEPLMTLWVCMLCGHVGCGASTDRSSHSRDHYRATLHAYALDVTTRHVWDFSSDSYVHQLFLQEDDEEEQSYYPGKATHEGDPTEDPAGKSASTVRGLSRLAALHARAPPADDKVVHSKLQGLAMEFNELLQSQLARQRETYLARLAAIDDANFGELDDVSSLVEALGREKSAVETRSTRARTRLAKAGEDASFLRELNSTLKADAARWAEEEAAARDALAKARRRAEDAAAPLEERLADLMARLDGGSPADNTKQRDSSGLANDLDHLDVDDDDIYK